MAQLSIERLRRPLAFTGLAAALLVGLPAVLVGGASRRRRIDVEPASVPQQHQRLPKSRLRQHPGIRRAHRSSRQRSKSQRPGVGVVGSAIGTISGDDVAFEVNHPGGICWGNGTGLAVTPDIQAGDIVSVKIAAPRLRRPSTSTEVRMCTPATPCRTGTNGDRHTATSVPTSIATTSSSASSSPALVDTDRRQARRPRRPRCAGSRRPRAVIRRASRSPGAITRSAPPTSSTPRGCHHRRPRRSRRAGDGMGAH